MRMIDRMRGEMEGVLYIYLFRTTKRRRQNRKN